MLRAAPTTQKASRDMQIAPTVSAAARLGWKLPSRGRPTSTKTAKPIVSSPAHAHSARVTRSPAMWALIGRANQRRCQQRLHEQQGAMRQGQRLKQVSHDRAPGAGPPQRVAHQRDHDRRSHAVLSRNMPGPAGARRSRPQRRVRQAARAQRRSPASWPVRGHRPIDGRGNRRPDESRRGRIGERCCGVHKPTSGRGAQHFLNHPRSA
jgi:hypothetical protein